GKNSHERIRKQARRDRRRLRRRRQHCPRAGGRYARRPPAVPWRFRRGGCVRYRRCDPRQARPIRLPFRRAGSYRRAPGVRRGRPFLGVFGAADASGIADATLAKLAGYVYLFAVQEVTGERVTCDAAGFLADVPARRFRVVRGPLRIGATWTAATARHAVALDT